MKIAISSLGDPFNYQTWSGIPFHISKALKENGHEVEPIVLKFSKEPWHYNWKRRFNWWLFNKWFLSNVQKEMLQNVGRQLDERVREINPDIVIVIHGDFLAYTTFRNPACIIHDTTFHSIVNYYSAFSKLTNGSVKSGHEMYRKALERADVAIFSSSWASKSAIEFYGKEASNVHTIPFGANLSLIPADEHVQEWINKRHQSETLEFLFIGVDWERKGGPDAISFIMQLNKLGVKSILTVVGCSPTIPKGTEDFVRVIGFLYKTNSNDRKLLHKLLINSVALLVPSTAECYGCVYCEANAYGLPVIARDTGGVSEIVKEGVNGFLIANEPLSEVALKWKNVWLQNFDYEKLALNSHKEFKDRLNYEIFTEKLNSIICDVLSKKEVI